MNDSIATDLSPLKETEKFQMEMNKELESMRIRIKALEVEQENSGIIKDQLKLSRSVNDRLIGKIETEQNDSSDNFHVISDMMEKLKSPIHKVVGNLTEWGAMIDDEELRKSFEDCVKTANTVIKSFNQAEKFCKSIVDQTDSDTVNLNLKECLRNKIMKTYNDISKFKLFIDKDLSGNVTISQEVLENSLEMVLNRLITPENHNKQVMISLMKMDADQLDYDDQIKLVVRIVSDKKTEMTWNGNWRESVDIDGDKQDMVPIDWLNCKNYLKNINGNLVVLSKENKVIGSEIHLPMTK